MKKFYIPFLVFWVGQRCTLHCRDCCNLIPYGHQRIYDFATTMEALYMLLSVCEVTHLQIQGGEPLTHPYIAEYITLIGKLPIQKITMTTNGTVPLSDALVKALQANPHISVTISNYNVRNDVRAGVLKQLKEANIEHMLYDFLYGTGEWFCSGGYDIEQKMDEEAVMQYYENCVQKQCWTLAEGRLAVCGKIITLSEKNAQKVKNNEKERCSIVNVLHHKGTTQALEDALYAFMNASQYPAYECRFCHGTEAKVEPAIQLTPEEMQAYKKSRRGIFT